MSNFNSLQDQESKTEYVSSGAGPLISQSAIPKDIVFTPPGVVASSLTLVMGLTLLSLACMEWDHHDIKGECDLINSGTEYISQIPGCNTAPIPSNFKDCIKKICKKDNDVYYGQCEAPRLAIAGGLLSMAAAAAAVAGWYLSDYRRATTIVVSLFALAAFFICASAFVTSFYRFGNGNTNDRENIILHGDPKDYPNSSDCHYTYEYTRGDWKAMTAFSFLSATACLLLAIHTCLWCHRLNMADKENKLARSHMEGAFSENLVKDNQIL